MKTQTTRYICFIHLKHKLGYLMFLAFMGITFSCNTKTPEALSSTFSDEESGLIKVNTLVIAESTFQKQIVSNGKIEANQKGELRFKTSNQIAKIYVKNGQRVTSGQTIASLDNTLVANDLEKARLEFIKAESKLQEEKINFEVSNKKEEEIPPLVLKNLKIKSGFFEAENALKNAQIMYDQTILKAPFSGVIANLEAKQGNYITPGDEFCFVISQNKLDVSFPILEGEFGFIQKGQTVDVLPFALKDKKYVGLVSEINPLVDENGLIKIKAAIDNEDAQLFDGMNVKVFINQPIENVVVIPKEALVLRSNKEVVFTIENGYARWNYVDIIDENNTHYAIKNGIELNDTIVVSGNLNLSHDAKLDATLVRGIKE